MGLVFRSKCKGEREPVNTMCMLVMIIILYMVMMTVQESFSYKVVLDFLH